MAKRVYISPSDQVENKYAWGNTNEHVQCQRIAEAEAAAKELAANGVTAMELCAGFGNEGIARIQRAVGPDVAVGAVKFDFHPAFGFKSGDEMFG